MPGAVVHARRLSVVVEPPRAPVIEDLPQVEVIGTHEVGRRHIPRLTDAGLDLLPRLDHLHGAPAQGQVQTKYTTQEPARLVMHTEHLTDDALRAVHLEQTRDIAATVAAEGDRATVCVLPEGPQTIAYVG